MSLKVHPDIASLSPYVPGKPIEELQRELGLTRVIKLASNENPLGSSPKALAALSEGIATLHRYPDGGAFRLREALADRWKVTPGSGHSWKRIGRNLGPARPDVFGSGR